MISFTILLEGYAERRFLKKGVVPTINIDSLENVELSAQRASRIEKRDNKKIVNSLLKESYTEDAAKQRQVEVNVTEDRNLECLDISISENVECNSNKGDESLNKIKIEL